MTFEEAALSVWRQSLVEMARVVNLEGDEFPVRSTAKQKLKQVDFRFDGRDFRALEQNPNTKSRRAAMARKHQKVMQFLEGGTETEPKASTRQQMIRPPKCRNPETEREKRPMRSSLGDEIEPGCDAFNPQTSNLSASLAVLSHQYSLSERQHLQPRIWYH